MTNVFLSRSSRLIYRWVNRVDSQSDPSIVQYFVVNHPAQRNSKVHDARYYVKLLRNEFADALNGFGSIKGAKSTYVPAASFLSSIESLSIFHSVHSSCIEYEWAPTHFRATHFQGL